MSADQISKCPRCRERELREWIEVYNDCDDGAAYAMVTLEYQCRCRSCGFADTWTGFHSYRGAEK